MLTDTLFKFDKSGSEDMIPGGLQRLADVAQRLKAYKSIQTLTVLGYTDRLGSDEIGRASCRERVWRYV